MNDRMLQVNEVLRERLAHIFSIKLEIPVEFFVTIIRVNASPDLRNATVWISVLPKGKERDGMAWLINHRKEIQKILGVETKKMKNTPQLFFKLDMTGEKTQDIYDLMDGEK